MTSFKVCQSLIVGLMAKDFGPIAEAKSMQHEYMDQGYEPSFESSKDIMVHSTWLTLKNIFYTPWRNEDWIQIEAWFKHEHDILRLDSTSPKAEPKVEPSGFEMHEIDAVIMEYTNYGTIPTICLEHLLRKKYPAWQFDRMLLKARVDKLRQVLLRYPFHYQISWEGPTQVVSLIEPCTFANAKVPPCEENGCSKVILNPDAILTSNEISKPEQHDEGLPEAKLFEEHTVDEHSDRKMFHLTYHYASSDEDVSLRYMSKESEDAELLLQVVLYSWNVLCSKDTDLIKSVELANEVRHRVGSEGFQLIKQYFAGFLSLLEAFPKVFQVHRIPKEDMVRTTKYGRTNTILSRLFEELSHSSGGLSLLRPSDAPILPSKSLYIGSIPNTISEDECRKVLSKFNPTSVSLFLKTERRYGFLNFATLEAATIAKTTLESDASLSLMVEFAKRSLT